MSATPIPDRYVFVWDDSFWPYPNSLAIRSVAARCRPERIVLLKTPQLDDVPAFQQLRRDVPCLDPVNIDLPGWLEEAQLPCTRELLDANRFLKERRFHGSVSDLLRALDLYLHGGVYLDTDTLTLRDLAPLRAQTGFVAEERILVSSSVYRRNSRWRYLRTGPLTAARALCSKFPWGVPWFQAIEGMYVRALHNAVMGFRPAHPLPRDILVTIAERYPRRPERYPLLGPDTVQDLMETGRYPDVTVHPPSFCSPLGPTMTFQYFHLRNPRSLAAIERHVVRDDTLIVHWSNNATIASTIPRDDEALHGLADRQLFAHLAVRAIAPGEPA